MKKSNTKNTAASDSLITLKKPAAIETAMEKAPVRNAILPGLNSTDIYLKELAWWISFPKNCGTRYLALNRDIAALTKREEAPDLSDYVPRSPDFVSAKKKLKYKNTSFLLFKSIAPAMLTDEKMKDRSEELQFSSHHQLLLSNMLEAVENNFDKFLHYLYAFNSGRVMPSDDKTEAALSVLHHVIESMDAVLLAGEAVIPDLISFDPFSVLLLHDEKWVKEHLPGRGKERFTYLFSRDTAMNFYTVLIELFNKKIAAQRKIKQSGSMVIQNSENTKNILSANHREKMKQFIEYFNLNTSRKKGEGEFSTEQYIFLFQMLQKKKLFVQHPKQDANALAIGILTGISIDTLYNENTDKRFSDYLSLLQNPGQELRKKQALHVCARLKEIAMEIETEITASKG